MLTPRDKAATPNTRSRSTNTLPIPTRAFRTVCDTTTAREDPEPWGTTMTVHFGSELRRISFSRPNFGLQGKPIIDRACGVVNGARA
jgi:hypothetical protein